MSRRACDVLVIGSGPAGLAAAQRARQEGAASVLVIERSRELGGILTQCIHNGFGVRVFGEDLTGPEYADRWIDKASKAGVQFLTDTMVLSLDRRLSVVAANGRDGLIEIDARAIVLTMGCRERPRGALAIPGSRPSGVYTAGTAQRLVNIEGYMPGNRVVILGSGDIGMIMARRLTLEGAKVEMMLEILPYVSGLRRNLVQCIRDYDIPLRLCTTVTRVVGEDRVEGLVISQVDERWQPVPGSRDEIACDTLLLSVGLIPENELTRMAGIEMDRVTGGPLVDARYATSQPGVFAAGNVVHVYDLVDDVTESALRAGSFAARRALGVEPAPGPQMRLAAGENVRHVVPQRVPLNILREGPVELHMRVRSPIEEAVRVEARADGHVVASRRLRYARPSEMVSLVLEPSLAARLAEDERLELRVVRV